MTTKDQAIAVTEEMITAAESVEDLYRRGTPDTWRKVYLAMSRAAQLPAPDCRTCQQYQEDEGICLYPLNHGLKQCTNGDQYQPAPKVVLWRTKP